MDIVFIRHGSTELNENHVYGGVSDVKMSQKGISEIKNIEKYIKNIEFDSVYTSPLKRAIESTRLITESYRIDDRLSELNFGIFEGLNYDNICDKYPEESKAWIKDVLNYRIPEGESLKDLFNRTKDFIDSISNGMGNGKILVVTHGGVIACVLSLVFKQQDYFYKFKVMHGMASVVSIEEGYMYIKGINCRDNIVDVL